MRRRSAVVPPLGRSSDAPSASALAHKASSAGRSIGGATVFICSQLQFEAGATVGLLIARAAVEAGKSKQMRRATDCDASRKKVANYLDNGGRRTADDGISSKRDQTRHRKNHFNCERE